MEESHSRCWEEGHWDVETPMSCPVNWATGPQMPPLPLPLPTSPSISFKEGKNDAQLCLCLCSDFPGPGRMEPGQLAIVGCKGQRLAWPDFRAPSQYLGSRTPPSGNQGPKDTCLHIPGCGPPTLVLKNESIENTRSLTEPEDRQ